MTFSQSSLRAFLLSLAVAVPAAAGRIEITAHGARSADGADDAAAIQAALNAAAVGDTVYFPAGTWNVSAALQPKSGTAALGAGETTELRPSGTGKHPFFTLNDKTGVEIGRMALDAGPATTGGIKAAGGSGHFLHHLHISDIVAEGFSSVGIHFSSGVVNGLIADNILTNMTVDGEWGAGIRISQGSSGNRILRNTVTNTGRGGILADNGSRRLVISGNRISGSGLANGGTGEGLGLEIWGGCDSSLIEDNEVDHWLSVDNSDFTAVRRNRLGTLDGTWKHCALELVGSNHCLFTDNVSEGGSNIGLSVSNDPKKDYVYWAYNSLKGSNTWAAQIQGDDSGAAFHYFYGNSFLATPKNHPQALYQGQGHGMRFNSNGRFMTVDSNFFSGNGGSAIQFGGTLEGFQFLRNHIAGNVGIVAGAFSGTRVTWAGNTFGDNGPSAQEPVSKGTALPALPVAFDVSGSAGSLKVVFTNRMPAGGALVRYLWDFGEGLPSDRMSPEHTYATTGRKRVTLIAWDDQGRSGRLEKWIELGSTGVAVRRAPEARPARSRGARVGRSWSYRLPAGGVVDARGRAQGPAPRL